MNFNGINNITSIFVGTGYADPKADAGSLPEQEGCSMYESPITMLYGKIKQEIEQKEEAAIYKAIEECEIAVDKEELIKALQYDRRQYEKGKADMIEKIKQTREEIDELKREIKDLLQQNAELKRQLEEKEKEAGMGEPMEAPEAIKWLQLFKAGTVAIPTNKLEDSIDAAVEALRITKDFERAQILIGGRLNGRTYAYKCGLEDGMRKKIENIMNQAAKSFREYEKAKEECKSRYEKSVKESRKPAETHREKAELLPIDGDIKKCELTCMRCSKCKQITAVANYCQWCGAPINYESQETETEEDHEPQTMEKEL